MKSEDRRSFNGSANSKYDKIGKSAAKKLISYAYPDWELKIMDEQYKRGDLFYQREDGSECIVEAEARTEDNWKGIFSGRYTVRIPNGKNPHDYPQCEWDIYVQTGEKHQDQGLFFSPNALKGAKKERNVRYKEDGEWKTGTFIYPDPNQIVFYEIIDGEVVIKE